MSQVKGINPGRLNRRITIMRYQAIEDELGNQVQQLVPLKSCWAEIRQIRGKEQLEYYKNVNELVYKITLRYTDVTEKDVVVYKGRQFQVNYPNNLMEDNRYLELMCTESKDHAVKEAEGG